MEKSCYSKEKKEIDSLENRIDDIFIKSGSLPNTLGENVGSKRKQFDEKQGSLVVNRRSSSVLSNLSEEEFLAIYSGNYERLHFSLASCNHLLLF